MFTQILNCKEAIKRPNSGPLYDWQMQTSQQIPAATLCSENSKIHSSKRLIPIHGTIADAIATVVGMTSKNSMSEPAEHHYGKRLCVIHAGRGGYFATLKIADGKTLAVATTTTGKLRAAIIEADGSLSNVKSVGPNAPKELPFITAVLYLMLLSDENQGVKDALARELEVTEIFEIIAEMDDANFAEGTTGGNITALTKQTLGSLASGEVIIGQQQIAGFNSKNARPKTMGEAMKMQVFTKWREELQQRRNWSAEEMKLIPSFADDYCVMEEAITLGERYILSKKMRRPFANMMWRGITSYGKSTGVEQMAALLGLPLVRVTCHTTMETNDFLTAFVPDNSTNTAIVTELPDLTTCVNCPDIAYSMLTGKEKDDVTVEEVQVLLYQKLAAKSAGSARFKIVESEFIRALQHGWLVEVQECSRIRDPGILVGLNEYDRAGARIPLCNGEFATRHEDALVLYTDNVGYNSCRPLDPSVLRRMSVIVDSTEMTEETVQNRIRYNIPGFDEKLLKKLYSIWVSIQKYCQEQGIDSGCCSVSELEMWCACVFMDNGENIIENCQSAVISKATADPIDQAAILAAVKTMGCPESIRDITAACTTPII